MLCTYLNLQIVRLKVNYNLVFSFSLDMIYLQMNITKLRLHLCCNCDFFFTFHCIDDCKEMINQSLMEMLLKIRDCPENPVLKIRPNFSYAVSPKKPGSSPRRYT